MRANAMADRILFTDGERFSLEGNRLIVRGELSTEDAARFSSALSRLLELGDDTPTVDLTQLDHMSCACIGAMFACAAAAQGTRPVTIHAGSAVGSVLVRSGLTTMARIEIDTGPTASPFP